MEETVKAFFNRFVRKRLVAFVVSTLTVPLAAKLGMPEEIISQMLWALVAYIGGQSLSDAVMAWAGNKVDDPVPK